jgi:hypothetical protein
MIRRINCFHHPTILVITENFIKRIIKIFIQSQRSVNEKLCIRNK